MENKQKAEVLLLGGMSLVIVLELVLLKSFEIVTKLDLKEILIVTLLISFYGYVLSQILEKHPGIERGSFTRIEKERLILTGVVILPTIIVVIVLTISKIS